MRFAALTQTAAVAQFAASVLAHPHAAASSGSSLQKRAIDISAFKYKLSVGSKYVKNEVIVEKGSLPRAAAGANDVANALVKSAHPGAEFRQVSSYSSKNGVTHVVFKQTLHGIDIDTADFNVNIKDGKVFSYGDSFFTGKLPAENPLVKRDQVDPVAALKGVSNTLSLNLKADGARAEPKEEVETYKITGSSGTISEPVGKLVYFMEGDSLRLTWRVETDVDSNWLLTYVDASQPESVVGLVDYVAEASYTVYPWKVSDPPKGSRVVEKDPWNLKASEFTWHGPVYTNTTRGNNGNAQANWANDAAIENDYRPYEADLNFNYDLDLQSLDPKTYANASTAQLFYTSNMYHDFLYVFGFDEVAGNFEANNNGAEGLGGDAVTLNTQDGAGLNNANFATPIDGQVPRMRMYIWNYTTPWKDSSFDAGVVIHEYTHGLTNRLTGGPLNAGCLSTTEAGGMGEGWSDFYAIAIHTKVSDTRKTEYPMGDWIRSRPSGIRTYLYSTSLTTNPMTYEFANNSTLVHFIGTIWATILYEMMWNLIDEYGITDDRLPTFDAAGVPVGDGRFLAIQLVTDGLKLQPCRPTFLDARDAILDADKALTGGKNQCSIWKAFAKRGVGDNASRSPNPLDHLSRKNGFNLPSGVCGCNADNCLRALRATSPPTRLLESQQFCGNFTKTVVTDVSLVKSYLTPACTGNVISRVSSACKCLPSDG